MTLAVEEYEELHELIGELCDGAIDARRFARLEAVLSTDVEAQRFYVRYLDIHGTLRRLCIEEEAARPNDQCGMINNQLAAAPGPGGPSSFLLPHLPLANDECGTINDDRTAEPPPVTDRGPVHRSSLMIHHLPTFFSYVAASLILGIAVMAAWAWVAHGGRPTAAIARAPARSPYGDLEGMVVAKVVAAKGCRWADPGDRGNFRANEDGGAALAERKTTSAALAERKTTSATFAERKATIPLGPRAGDPLAIGRKLSLACGTLAIVYASGVDVTIEGPAEYVVDRRNGGDLRLGKATVRALGKGLGTAAGGTPAPPGTAADLLAAAQQVQHYHRTRFSLGTSRVVVVDHGGDFGLSVNAAGEVSADLIGGCVELWYPHGVTDKDTLRVGRFWGYAEEDRVRGGFRAVCQVGDAPLSAKMELANAERKNGGVFVSAEAATLLDGWRARSRLEGDTSRSGIP